MTQTTAADTAAAGKSFPARIVGVIFAPRAAYADVAARPGWIGAMLVVLLVTGGSTFAFLSTDIGKNAMLDQQRQTMESFGVKLNDQAIQRMEEGAARAPYFGAIGNAVFLPVAALVIAGIALAIFNAVLGGDAKFKQVFAIVVHSGVILAIGAVFVLPLDYARETLSSPTTLSVFLPFLEENSFVARFLGSIDLIRIWWFVSLSIGLGVLYRKRTGPIATTLLVVYAAIALVIAAIQSAVSGA
jgi:Yip1-like protein